MRATLAIALCVFLGLDARAEAETTDITKIEFIAGAKEKTWVEEPWSQTLNDTSCVKGKLLTFKRSFQYLEKECKDGRSTERTLEWKLMTAPDADIVTLEGIEYGVSFKLDKQGRRHILLLAPKRTDPSRSMNGRKLVYQSE